MGMRSMAGRHRMDPVFYVGNIPGDLHRAHNLPAEDNGEVDVVAHGFAAL